MKDIEIAKNKLKDENTLVLCKDNDVIISTLDGIKPLINLLNENKDVKGYSLADKIIGKAQAMLIVKAGIKEVYAKVLSKNGERILKKYNVPYSFDILTDEIINRKGTGPCPMEIAVKDIEDIEKAYEVLKEKVLAL